MAEEAKSPTTKVVVRHNSSAPTPRRITEEQFQRCPSDWLALAKRGQQIIVVDHPATAGPATMVLGMNGVLFQLADEVTETSLPKTNEPVDNLWLK